MGACVGKDQSFESFGFTSVDCRSDGCYLVGRSGPAIKLSTGDILLVGSVGMVSWLIRCYTGTPYSHVGMVIVTKDENRNWRAFMWHSDNIGDTDLPHALTDVLTGQKKSGVALVPLEAALRRMDSRGATVQLRRIGWKPDDPDLFRTHIDYFKRTAMKSYEEDIFELMNSQLRFGGGNMPNHREFFCSELMSNTYRQFGWSNRNVWPWADNDVVPADFSSGGSVRLCGDPEEFEFLGKRKFREEIEIYPVGRDQ